MKFLTKCQCKFCWCSDKIVFQIELEFGKNEVYWTCVWASRYNRKNKEETKKGREVGEMFLLLQRKEDAFKKLYIKLLPFWVYFVYRAADLIRIYLKIYPVECFGQYKINMNSATCFFYCSLEKQDSDLIDLKTGNIATKEGNQI